MEILKIKEKLKINIVSDENDTLFHKAYILCCDIFPGMMPYYIFRREIIVVVLLNDILVGFMVLENTNNFFCNALSKQFVKSSELSDSSDLSELVELASNDEINYNNEINYNDKNNCNMQLLSIGIDNNFRGKNIGFECIEWIKKHYPKANISLHVSVKNYSAISLYNKCGFIINSKKELYYDEQGFEPYTKDGRDAYIMTYYIKKK